MSESERRYRKFFAPGLGDLRFPVKDGMIDMEEDALALIMEMIGLEEVE